MRYVLIAGGWVETFDTVEELLAVWRDRGRPACRMLRLEDLTPPPVPVKVA